MFENKPCDKCKNYKTCCYNSGWSDAQWYRYYNIEKGYNDCWDGDD